MSKRDEQVYLGHMLDTARKAVAKLRGKSRAEFDADENLRLSLTHLIQIIGEAARQVSPQCAADHPEIPWRGIIGMRHRVVHDYLHVEFEVVWNVVRSDLPPLIAALEQIVPPEPPEPVENA